MPGSGFSGGPDQKKAAKFPSGESVGGPLSPAKEARGRASGAAEDGRRACHRRMATAAAAVIQIIGQRHLRPAAPSCFSGAEATGISTTAARVFPFSKTGT